MHPTTARRRLAWYDSPVRSWRFGLGVLLAMPACVFGGGGPGSSASAGASAGNDDGGMPGDDGPVSAEDGVPPPGTDGDDDGPAPTGDTGTADTADDGTDSDPDTDEDDGTAEDDDTGGQPAAGCPEPLPEGWIFCEDFEGDEPEANFDSFPNADEFAVSDELAHSGSSAIRIRHLSGQNNVGSAHIRFGDAPQGRVIEQPESQFDEVWVRAWVANDLQWPGGGHGESLKLEALAAGDARVSHAMMHNFHEDDVQRMLLSTCVNDGMLECDGVQDFMDDVNIASAPGTAPINASGQAGQWHCVVLHARLNDSGDTNGAGSLSVDGQLEVEADQLDWRGPIDVGFNRLRVTSWATPAGTDDDRTRYVDDVAVAAVELTCP